MQFRNALWLFLALLPALAGAQPVEETARIEVSGETSQPVEFEVTSVSNSGKSAVSAWATTEAAKKRIFSITFPAGMDWKEGSFTITPAQSGRISVTLLGPYVPAYDGAKELIPIMVDYDQVVSDEVMLKNGDFENVLSGNRVNDWYQADNTNSNPPLDDQLRARAVSGDAPDGSEYFARVWHNSSLSQVFDVSEGEPITIRFYYRLGME